MLSRVAETLYWLGRYVERAENTARIVNVNANLLLDLPKGIAPVGGGVFRDGDQSRRLRAQDAGV